MSGSRNDARHIVRNTRPEDFEAIERISRVVYPHDAPWTAEYLATHRDVFPEGQFVAVDAETGRVAGTAISLIIRWDDYDHLDDYDTMTDAGYLTNHDPSGRTLYGAEVMVDPALRGRGIGSLLYAARRELTERLGLLRIRAGARMPGYHDHAARMDVATYVEKVIDGELCDPTLSFQLRHGFHVLAVVPNYYSRDPRSRDFAALIEWINLQVARPEDYAGRSTRFSRDRSRSAS